MDYSKIFSFIPEVIKPEEKNLSFNTKLKWTLIVVGAFFVLMHIPLFGLSESALSKFEIYATLMGTDFGSIIALGIGPIVMGSIILQLLSGSGLINIDTNTVEGKRLFQGLQKLLVLFFIIFEACVFVLMNGFQADAALGNIGPTILIIQLVLGGITIFYMNELCEKWGFGSGVSLFIAAGVSLRLITSAFQFVNQQGQNCLLNFTSVACSGKVLLLVQAIVNKYAWQEFVAPLAILLATVLIYLIVVWAQSLKVEVPLSFGGGAGRHGIRKNMGIKWPLSFFYASVIPVILTAALVAQIQMFGGIFENAASPCTIDGDCAGLAGFASHLTFLGHFVDGRAVSGFAFWTGSTNLLELFIRGGFLWKYALQGLTHTALFVFLCSLFSVLWVKTSGMDAKDQAQKIAASGLHIAGFRQDTRILETILDRYIMPLTVMGGAAIGLLASVTNLLGALVSGTSMLLVTMVVYQFATKIVEQHATEMNPAIKKFMGK